MWVLYADEYRCCNSLQDGLLFTISPCYKRNMYAKI